MARTRLDPVELARTTTDLALACKLARRHGDEARCALLANPDRAVQRASWPLLVASEDAGVSYALQRAVIECDDLQTLADVFAAAVANRRQRHVLRSLCLTRICELLPGGEELLLLTLAGPEGDRDAIELMTEAMYTATLRPAEGTILRALSADTCYRDRAEEFCEERPDLVSDRVAATVAHHHTPIVVSGHWAVLGYVTARFGLRDSTGQRIGESCTAIPKTERVDVLITRQLLRAWLPRTTVARRWLAERQRLLAFASTPVPGTDDTTECSSVDSLAQLIH